MSSLYEVLFYDGEASQPAYYLIDSVEGTSPEDAIQRNTPAMVETARSMLSLGTDYPEHRIREALYVVRSKGLVGVGKGD